MKWLPLVWLAVVATILWLNHRAAVLGRALDAACDEEIARKEKDAA